MTHTPETLPELVDQLHKEIEGKNIALAKRLEWIRKVEATNADLLAALRELRAAFAHVATSTASLALLDRTSAAIAKAEVE